MYEKSNILWHQSVSKKWKFYKIPARPSRGDVKVYEKLFSGAIKGKKNSKVLILGSTPELRDLAHKYKTEVTIIDISLEMMMAMRQFMKYKDETEKESWVKSGWLKNPLDSEYFDVILGDFVNENIPFNLHKEFYKELARLLKKNGYFITRVMHCPSKKTLPEETIAKYLKLKDFVNLLEEMFFDLLVNSAKPPSFEMPTKNAILSLEDYKKGQKNKKLLDSAINKLNFLYSPKTWWGTTKEIFQSRIKKNFQINKIENARNYSSANYYPIYLLKKK